MRNTNYAKLEKKLRADSASILTAAEVRLIAREIRRLLGPPLAKVLPGAAARVEDTVRWWSLKARCEEARAERGVSVKDVAIALRVPQYRLKAVERGTWSELRADVARRYFRFLGIEPWVERWCKANPALARRTAITGRATKGGGREVRRHATEQATAAAAGVHLRPVKQRRRVRRGWVAER